MDKIDKLEIEIEASSTKAAQSIKALSDALKGLKENVPTNATAKRITDLSNALKSIDKDAGIKLNQFAKAFERLGAISNIKINKNPGDNLRSIADSAQSVSNDAIERLDRLTSSLQKLANVDMRGAASAMRIKVDSQRIEPQDSGKEQTNGGDVAREGAETKKTLADIRQSIMQANSLWKTFSSAGTSALNTVSEKSKDAAYTISDSIKNAFRRFTQTGIIKEFSDAFRGVDKEAAEHLQPVTNAAKYVGATIAQPIISGIQKTFPWLERLRKRFSEASKNANEIGNTFRAKVNSGLSKSVSNASKLSKFLESIKRIALYRIIRSALKAIVGAARTGINNIYQYSAAAGTGFKEQMDALASSTLYIKNAIGTFADSIIQTLTPSILFLIDKFVDLVNVANEFIAVLRNKETFTRAVKVEQEYAKANEYISKSADKATKSVNKFLLGIDEINRANDTELLYIGKMFEEADVSNPFKEALANGFEESGIKDVWDKASAALVDSLNNAKNKIKDLFSSIWYDFLNVAASGRAAEMLSHIMNIITGMVDRVGILTERFRIAWETNDVGRHILENICDTLNIILGTIEKAVDITKEWSSGLDFYPILDSFERLTTALNPFVQLLMDGLLWAYENVLLPVAKWTIEKAFPAVLDVATSAVNLFTAALTALQPLGQWLWENFLKPISTFTGDAIINALTSIRDILQGLADFLNGDTSFREFLDNLSLGEKLILAFASALAIKSAVTAFIKLIAAMSVVLTSAGFKMTLLVVGVVTLAYAIDQAAGVWDKMTGLQKVVTVLGAIVSVAFLAAAALGAFHTAATMGIAAIAITAGIAAVMAAVAAAKSQAESNLSRLNAREVKPYANGGFPKSGQLFMARENGAELVGSIGNRTAVANNWQIVEGISEGVAYANGGVIGAINQLIEVVQQIDPTVELDGLAVSRRLHKYNRQVSIEAGTPLAVEVRT